MQYKTMSERRVHLLKWIGGFVVGFVLGGFMVGVAVYTLMGNYIIATFG